VAAEAAEAEAQAEVEVEVAQAAAEVEVEVEVEVEEEEAPEVAPGHPARAARAGRWAVQPALVRTTPARAQQVAAEAAGQ
jgi:hypothetical protein